MAVAQGEKILDLCLTKSEILAWVLEAMTNVVTHANFNCSDEGLSIEESDANGLPKVYLFLPALCFERYHCCRKFARRMNVKNAEKILRCFCYNDILTLEAEVGSEFVNFVFENPDQSEIAAFKMTWANADFKGAIAEIEFDTVFRLSSRELASIWGYFSDNSDTVRISVSKECVRISSTGDIGNASIIYWQKSRVHGPEEAIILKMKEPVSTALDISHFRSFTKAFQLSSEVIISMSSGQHVLVEYKVAQFGHLRFYLPTKEMEAKRYT